MNIAKRGGCRVFLTRNVTNWNDDDLEIVSCDLCGRDETRAVIVRPDGLTVVECTSCGLCYINPRPKPHLITRLYERDYFSKDGQPVSLPGIGYRNYFSDASRGTLRTVAAQKFSVVRNYIDVRGLRCLEVGCAAGEFADVLHRNGAKVLAIDLSAPAIEEARSRYPSINFRQGDLASLTAGDFDVVFAFEVIEHVTSPNDLLRSAANRLKPRGWLVLSTPNQDCGKAVGVQRWCGFSTSFEHLYFFDAERISRYGASAGLSTLDWLTDLDTGILPGSGGGSPVSSLALAAKALLKRMHLFEVAKALKAKATAGQPEYISHGRGHNLFMVMSKSHSPIHR